MLLPHLMGAGFPLWEKLHSSLSSIAPVLKGPSIGRHYGACSSEWVLILPRLPSGAGLWPGTFFKRRTVAGYTDRQPWCIFFATQFPHKLSMLPLCFQSVPWRSVVKNHVWTQFWLWRLYLLFTDVCPLFYLPSPLNSLMSPLRRSKALLTPSLPENWTNIWKGTDSVLSGGCGIAANARNCFTWLLQTRKPQNYRTPSPIR